METSWETGGLLLPGTKGGVALTDSGGEEGAQEESQMKSELS